MKKKIYKILIPIVGILGIVCCNNATNKTNPGKQKDTSKSKPVDDSYCYHEMSVKTFDFAWPTICQSIKIKVNGIYNDGTKDIIVIEGNNGESRYSVGDSISLYAINQEQSMAYVKKIIVRSDSAVLLIKCNCK